MRFCAYWQAFLALAVLAGVAYLIYRFGIGFDKRRAKERQMYRKSFDSHGLQMAGPWYQQRQ